MNTSEFGSSFIVVLTTLAGIAMTVFWMVVGWRAMRAHERIATASERANSDSTAKREDAAEGTKPCSACGKPMPKSYSKCLHCGAPQL